MQPLVDMVRYWHLHPVIDHFTVSLIAIGVLIDLVASLIPSRLWIRTMALTLMILGAAAAAGSNVTGGWEADRIWDSVTGPAKDVLKTHAEVGDWLPWALAGLAVWRFGLHFIGFLSGTRPIYLLVAVLGLGAITYQGYKGGELVYDYGVGTAIYPSATPTPAPSKPVPTVAPSVIPTVSVPTPTPTPTTVAPQATPSPMVSTAPAAAPTATSGTPVNPPPSSASPEESPAPKNL